MNCRAALAPGYAGHPWSWGVVSTLGTPLGPHSSTGTVSPQLVLPDMPWSTRRPLSGAPCFFCSPGTVHLGSVTAMESYHHAQ